MSESIFLEEVEHLGDVKRLFPQFFHFPIELHKFWACIVWKEIYGKNFFINIYLSQITYVTDLAPIISRQQSSSICVGNISVYKIKINNNYVHNDAYISL